MPSTVKLLWRTQVAFLAPSCSHGASTVVLVVKNLPANVRDARDTGLIPGSGRSPGEGNGKPLQYSFLENPMDREAWLATVHGVAASQARLSVQELTPSLVLSRWTLPCDSRQSLHRVLFPSSVLWAIVEQESGCFLRLLVLCKVLGTSWRHRNYLLNERVKK